MKHCLVLLAIVFCFGCRERGYHDAKGDFKLRPINFDSFYLSSHGLIPKEYPTQMTIIKDTEVYMRYFLVSYQSMLKDDHYPITGNVWFSSSGFPTKYEIDSLVYSGFTRKKSCYQSVIILNIYEFKNIEDYAAYSNDYAGEKHPKKKKDCCTECPVSLFKFPADTIIGSDNLQKLSTKYYKK